jgi:hypothetical protein
MWDYAAPDDVLVYLINEYMNGTPDRRLAATFILDCLRRYQCLDKMDPCLSELAKQAILDVGPEARSMALSLGLIEVQQRR